MMVRQRFRKKESGPERTVPDAYLVLGAGILVAVLYVLSGGQKVVEKREQQVAVAVGPALEAKAVNMSVQVGPDDAGAAAQVRRPQPQGPEAGVEIDAFKAGEEQVGRLYRKLEENPGMPVEERSNVVKTIRLLESGRILLQ